MQTSLLNSQDRTIHLIILLFFSIEISTSLLAAFKSVPTKYEEAKRRMKKDQEKSEEENLTNQLVIQINRLKSKETE